MPRAHRLAGGPRLSQLARREVTLSEQLLPWAHRGVPVHDPSEERPIHSERMKLKQVEQTADPLASVAPLTLESLYETRAGFDRNRSTLMVTNLEACLLQSIERLPELFRTSVRPRYSEIGLEFVCGNREIDRASLNSALLQILKNIEVEGVEPLCCSRRKTVANRAHSHVGNFRLENSRKGTETAYHSIRNRAN